MRCTEIKDVLIESTRTPWSQHQTKLSQRGAAGHRLNHLQLTGHVMHQQFNIQQLYALPTLYLCVLYLSEKKQRLVPLTA
jgi:hypothetical protein